MNGMKKHLVFVGLILSITLIVVATFQYPGGSALDKDSPGFSWTQNFFSNLFRPVAINGMANKARILAIAGTALLSMTYCLFFLNFVKKLPAVVGSAFIKIAGPSSMVCTFLIVTPLHDIMSAMASILFLLTMVMITSFILRTKLVAIKLACSTCVLLFIIFLLGYVRGQWDLLPALQKVVFLSMIFLTICLDYLTHAKHFSTIAGA